MGVKAKKSPKTNKRKTRPTFIQILVFCVLKPCTFEVGRNLTEDLAELKYKYPTP